MLELNDILNSHHKLEETLKFRIPFHSSGCIILALINKAMKKVLETNNR